MTQLLGVTKHHTCTLSGFFHNVDFFSLKILRSVQINFAKHAVVLKYPSSEDFGFLISYVRGVNLYANNIQWNL
jgi:hypothetical protein